MIRRCNPCNVRLSQDKWQGGIYPPPATAKGYVVFISNAFGYRAAIKILQSYQRKYNLRTIRSLVSRYCPLGDGDNAPDVYATNVSVWSGIGTDTLINAFDRDTMTKIVAAMSRQESSQVDLSALRTAFDLL